MQKCINVNTIPSQQQCFAGEVSIDTLPNLQSSLAEKGAIGHYSIVCAVDTEGYTYLEGKATATVKLICERCLNVMDRELVSHFALSPVTDDEQAKDLPVRYEAIVVDKEGKIALADLLEQELILQLPLVPKHEQMNCNQLWQKENFEAQRPNPFTVLAALKQK